MLINLYRGWHCTSLFYKEAWLTNSPYSFVLALIFLLSVQYTENFSSLYFKRVGQVLFVSVVSHFGEELF